MKISYFHKSATSINDRVRIGDCISFVGWHIRQYSPKLSKVKCQLCGAGGKLEIHHIRPVWTYAVQIMIDMEPQTIQDLMHLYNDAPPHTDCNNLDNLIILCKPCHGAEEKIAYRKWKKHFEDNYRVVFGIRNLRRQLELVGRKPSASDLR